LAQFRLYGEATAILSEHCLGQLAQPLLLLLMKLPLW
jgi:hypothetical protein